MLIEKSTIRSNTYIARESKVYSTSMLKICIELPCTIDNSKLYVTITKEELVQYLQEIEGMDKLMQSLSEQIRNK